MELVVKKKERKEEKTDIQPSFKDTKKIQLQAFCKGITAFTKDKGST